MKINRKIKKVYVIEMKFGLEKEILKIVSNKNLADQYMKKYEEKYPQQYITCNQVDYVEAY